MQQTILLKAKSVMQRTMKNKNSICTYIIDKKLKHHFTKL